MREIAGNGLSEKQLRQVFVEVDTDCNGLVDYDEFLAGQHQLRKWRQKKKPKGRRRTSANRVPGIASDQ